MVRLLLGAVLVFSTAAAAELPVCSGGNRAERRLTCIVDGDTGWHRGENWRLVGSLGGVDTPEISRPGCAEEKRKGVAARDRLRELMGSGYEIARGKKDRYERTLVTITLSDGRDAGDVLIAEGLAQRWPNRGNVWCATSKAR